MVKTKTVPLVLLLLLLSAPAAAQCVTGSITARPFLLCQTEASRPVVALTPSTLAVTFDTLKFWVALTPTTWTEVSPSGAGGGAWGAITGTLANQTDLQTALDAKAATTQALDTFGATTDTTTRNVTTAAHGLMSKLPGGATNFFREDGTWGLPASGGVAWGAITGMLADQTDLQTALDAKQVAGTYATGTGTANGTNTGDQTTIVGITGTLAEFNTALTGADFATGGGTATGTNTGDQTTISGNAGTATALQTARTINGVSFDGTANIQSKLDDAAAPDDNIDLNATISAHGLMQKYPGGTTNFLRADGTFAAPAGGSSYRTLVTLGGDVTDSAGAATYTDCTGLSFPVTAGVRYHFYALIWYTSAAAATGSKWAINGPAATDMAYASRYTLAATTQTLNFAAAYDIPAAANATSLTTKNVAVLEGTVLPSANGTVVVRFATEVNLSAVTCKAGSTLEWW